MTTCSTGKLPDNIPWYVGCSITVHPLGGCPWAEMSASASWTPTAACLAIPGLYIADGSVLPGPVGLNPSNRIAALAHPFAEQIIAEVG
jgi:cholesterol oxidase